MAGAVWARLTGLSCSLWAICGVAAADLTFVGSVPQRQRITALHARAPASVRALPVGARMVTERDLKQKLGSASFEIRDPKTGKVLRRLPIAGYYWRGAKPPEVWMKTGVDVAFTFSHEFGHAVWNGVLTVRQKGEWGSFWSSHKADLPRDYSRTSAEEGFADAFGWWLRGDRLNAAMKAKVEGLLK